MKKRIFKVTIAGQVVSMYRRKRIEDRIMFDSIMNECKGNGRSPGKELIQRLFNALDIYKNSMRNEDCLLGYLKDKAVDDFGDWSGNLQEAIWQLLRF